MVILSIHIFTFSFLLIIFLLYIPKGGICISQCHAQFVLSIALVFLILVIIIKSDFSLGVVHLPLCNGDASLDMISVMRTCFFYLFPFVSVCFLVPAMFSSVSFLSSFSLLYMFIVCIESLHFDVVHSQINIKPIRERQYASPFTRNEY